MVSTAMGLRVSRFVGSARTARTDGFELRFLLVGELAIEVVKRRAHGLYRLQHDVEPFTDGGKSRRRRQRLHQHRRKT